MGGNTHQYQHLKWCQSPIIWRKMKGSRRHMEVLHLTSQKQRKWAGYDSRLIVEWQRISKAIWPSILTSNFSAKLDNHLLSLCERRWQSEYLWKKLEKVWKGACGLKDGKAYHASERTRPRSSEPTSKLSESDSLPVTPVNGQRGFKE